VKELLPEAAIILAPNLEAHYKNLDEGICNVIAGEPADISEAVVRASGYVGDYEVRVWRLLQTLYVFPVLMSPFACV
jgi:hypothetical protein